MNHVNTEMELVYLAKANQTERNDTFPLGCEKRQWKRIKYDYY